MIGYLFKFLNPLDMRPNDRLLFLKYTNIPIYLGIRELLILEGFQGSWNLILSLVIEHNVVRASSIVYLELRPHGLFYAPE